MHLPSSTAPTETVTVQSPVAVADLRSRRTGAASGQRPQLTPGAAPISVPVANALRPRCSRLPRAGSRDRTSLAGTSARAARPLRSGYDFLYWLKCACGARALRRRGPALRACGAGAPVPTRTPPLRAWTARRAPRPQTSAHDPRARASRRNLAHHRAADPIPNGLHGTGRHQGHFVSLRDDLRPPLTPTTAEQLGWLSGRWLSPGRGLAAVALVVALVSRRRSETTGSHAHPSTRGATLDSRSRGPREVSVGCGFESHRAYPSERRAPVRRPAVRLPGSRTALGRQRNE